MSFSFSSITHSIYKVWSAGAHLAKTPSLLISKIKDFLSQSALFRLSDRIYTSLYQRTCHVLSPIGNKFQVLRDKAFQTVLIDGQRVPFSSLEVHFLEATKNNQVDKLELILSRYEPASSVKYRALEIATRQGNIEALNFLMKSQAYFIHAQDFRVIAVEKGDVKLLECLIQKFDYSYIPTLIDHLEVAVKHHKLELVKFLLTKVNLCGRDGQDDRLRGLLEFAAKHGDLSIFQVIEEFYQNEHGQLTNIQLALCCSEAANYRGDEILEYLLQKSSFQTKTESTPPEISAIMGKALKNAACQGKSKIVSLLSSYRDAISGFDMRVCIDGAATKGYLEILEVLLNQNEISRLFRDRLLLQPLNAEIASCLRNALVIEDRPEFLGSLLRAIQSRNLQELQAELTNDIRLQQADLKRFIQEAATRGNVEIIQFLLGRDKVADHEIILFVLNCATTHSHIGVLRFLLSHDFQLKDTEIQRAFFDAIKAGQLEVLKFFIFETKFLNYAMLIDSFVQAAQDGHVNILRYLITENFLLDKSVYPAAFQAASRANHLEILRFLLVDDPDLKTEVIHEAILKASESNDLETLKFLFSHVKSLNQQMFVKSVESAAISGHVDCLRFLLSEGRALPTFEAEELLLKLAPLGKPEIIQFILDQGRIVPSVLRFCLYKCYNNYTNTLVFSTALGYSFPAVPRAHEPINLEPFKLKLEDFKINPAQFLEQIYTEGIPSRVDLIDNHVIDQGGVSKQFISTLAEALESQRLLSVNEMRIPTIREDRIEADKKLMMHLGSLYSQLFSKNQHRTDPLLVGSLLHDRFFDLVKIIIQSDTEENKLKSAATLLKKIDPSTEITANLVINPSLENKKAYAELMGNDECTKEDIDDVKSIFYGYLSAAQYFQHGMSVSFTSRVRDADSKELIESLQGVSVTASKILDALTLRGEDTYFVEKVEWIKEKLKELDAKFLERFIKTITGKATVTPGLKISFKDSHRGVFEYHTCFNSLDIPQGSMSKLEFLQAFTSSIEGDGYNTV